MLIKNESKLYEKWVVHYDWEILLANFTTIWKYTLTHDLSAISVFALEEGHVVPAVRQKRP